MILSQNNNKGIVKELSNYHGKNIIHRHAYTQCTKLVARVPNRLKSIWRTGQAFLYRGHKIKFHYKLHPNCSSASRMGLHCLKHSLPQLQQDAENSAVKIFFYIGNSYCSVFFIWRTSHVRVQQFLNKGTPSHDL